MVCPSKRYCRLIPLVMALAALSGCQDDEVRHYRVARIETPSSRLLAAILPVGEKVWFVSATGPAPAVANLLPQFESFVQNLRFPENERRRVTWDLPAEWHREPNRDRMRYATFRAGADALEIRVYSFGPESGDLLPNVNRWRGQIGLGEIAAADLATVSRPITVNGVAGTFVDMTGPGANAERPMAPAAAPPTAPVPDDGGTLAFDAPPGWVKQPLPPGSMRRAAFKVTVADKSAEVTVIPLPGQVGGLLANVNRWRGEVGLPDISTAELQNTAKKLESPAGSVDYVDLAGPKGERTLGAIMQHGGSSWFVKLRGPTDLVATQQTAFEAFVKSLRFEAGAKQ
jgi:hypothetical protein